MADSIDKSDASARSRRQKLRVAYRAEQTKPCETPDPPAKKTRINLKVSQATPKQPKSAEGSSPRAERADQRPTGICPGRLINTETSEQIQLRIDTASAKLDQAMARRDRLGANAAALARRLERFEAFKAQIASAFDDYRRIFSTLPAENAAAGRDQMMQDPTPDDEASEDDALRDVIQFIPADCAVFKDKLNGSHLEYKESVEKLSRRLGEASNKVAMMEIEVGLLRDVHRLKQNMEQHPDACSI